ncbi:hypothetical protein ACFWNH_29020 [Rhodococcus qingshengii]|uniref:hypothetical protein n=1 Tax=Rhodococcus qingshengii TaxID=334542 RepID=UPI00365D67FE
MHSTMFRRIVCTVVLTAAATAAAAVPALAAPAPHIGGDGHIPAPDRTAISFEHSPTGFHAGTANEHQSRAGLSIVELYIADYVFDHGDAADQAAAAQMLRTSDDAIASHLYGKYPNSIAATATAFGLGDTHAAAHWGDSTTLTADTVAYLEAKKRTDPGGPVLAALAAAAPVAADGYAQNYGTAALPGVIGTKWGWSDDRQSVTASASFGPDFSVAAHIYGPAAQLTADILGAFDTSAPAAPQPPAVMTLPDAATVLVSDVPHAVDIAVVVDDLTGHAITVPTEIVDFLAGLR